ncbi:MAG: ribonuclease E/G [Pseudomonadota bacterium]|nr:ribonuclease E/G [Pseudomonadota bacterium]
MSKKMLIDAGHREETRVVVVDGSKVEDFDFEAEARRPIRGNIYLAKVTRVEPSLQAAFVEYGGNRHGFLAFNEIHPDYYQIPYEDRVALAEEEASAVREEDEELHVEEAEAPAAAEDGEDAPEAPETIGDDSEDDVDDAQAARRRRQMFRKYKIQEVIKRRQILLVQVAKEERGNKGAALTTYLSLAGRYCVLMPNTPRGGGISRKISNAADRKRLKSVVNELDLPKGVGLIIRTAGASRTKTEIKRDADYLVRLWENIRQLTLKSVAPALIYEEGNLVKRAIRDLYDKEIDSVLVEGEEAYKEAKAFMRMLMPSHAKKVQHYKETVPLFLQHQVEAQLEAIYSPIAPLKSGGYIVINPTEALVSIDVNSGRATRERNIEATALKTNLEAAAEAARQMRLRDLAGLIVIDFIDMDENKNNRAVEKKMKDVLKRDRARLQVGRISQFGLMEISRQRRRTSLLEGSTVPCPTCRGSGHLRSTESSALVALRGLEREATRGKAKRVRISLPTAVAIYILNDKRDHLLAIEERFAMRIAVSADDTIMAPEFTIEALESREPGEELPVAPLSVESVEEIDIPDPVEAEDEAEESREGSGRRRRRRRRRKPGSGEDTSSAMDVIKVEDGDAAEAADTGPDEDGTEDGDEQPRKRRRRGRRGGRGRRRNAEGQSDEQAADSEARESDALEVTGDAPGENAPAENTEAAAEPVAEAEPAEKPAAEEKPKPKRRTRRKKTEEADSAAEAAPAEETVQAEAPEAAETPAAEDEKPKRRTRRPRKKAADAEAAPAEAAPAEEAQAEAPAEPASEPVAEEKPKPKRRAPRRKKAEPETPPATEAEAPAEETAAEDPAPEPESQPEPAAADAGGKADDKPKRRGWWNRTGLFGN